MIWIVMKLVVFGIILGVVLSIAFSLLTASASGRNVKTGEAMELKGIKAVYVQLAEYGPAYYLRSLLPSFLIFSILATMAIAILLMSTSV